MTTDSTSATLALADILHTMDMTPYQLAKMAGISTGTVVHATKAGGSLKTHYTSAERMARALGLEIEDIIWVNGLSDNGRTAGSSSEIERPYVRQPTYKTCPKHHTLLPASGICDECAA